MIGPRQGKAPADSRREQGSSHLSGRNGDQIKGVNPTRSFQNESILYLINFDEAWNKPEGTEEWRVKLAQM